MKITATRFNTDLVHPIDIHTMEDLLTVHQEKQEDFEWI